MFDRVDPMEPMDLSSLKTCFLRTACSSLVRSCCHRRSRGEGRYSRPWCGVVLKPSKSLASSGCEIALLGVRVRVKVRVRS